VSRISCLLIFLQERTFVSHLFLSSVLFTDEAHFSRDGIINIHNQNMTEENPCGVTHFRHQQHIRINAQTGIIDDCLVGPHFLPHQLTGNHH
jgi:hypothetical protein